MTILEKCTLCEWWWSTHREDIHWNYLKKMFLNWCNSSLLKEGRSQLGWYLNAKARKYLNTTGEDPTKIGRWRDSLRRRTWKGKFVAAWKTCLHPLYLHPVSANQSQSERSRNRKGALRKSLQWKQRIRDRKKRKYKLANLQERCEWRALARTLIASPVRCPQCTCTTQAAVKGWCVQQIFTNSTNSF